MEQGHRPTPLTRRDGCHNAKFTATAQARCPAVGDEVTRLKLFLAGFDLRLLTSSPTICSAGNEPVILPSRFPSNWWAQDIPRIRLPQLGKDSPKLRPEIFLNGIQLRISGQHAAGVGPRLAFVHQSRPHRIGGDVETHFGEGVAFALLCAQHMFLRLRLKRGRGQCRSRYVRRKAMPFR